MTNGNSLLSLSDEELIANYYESLSDDIAEEEKQVIEAIAALKAKQEMLKQRSIAEKFDIPQRNITQILRRQGVKYRKRKAIYVYDGATNKKVV